MNPISSNDQPAATEPAEDKKPARKRVAKPKAAAEAAAAPVEAAPDAPKKRAPRAKKAIASALDVAPALPLAAPESAQADAVFSTQHYRYFI